MIFNWILHVFGGDDFIRIGFLAGRKNETTSFEETKDYLSENEVHERTRAARSATSGPS